LCDLVNAALGWKAFTFPFIALNQAMAEANLLQFLLELAKIIPDLIRAGLGGDFMNRYKKNQLIISWF
jgi:hypothetical protein